MYKLACIPTFNEEGVIEKVIEKTLHHVDKVIVCDDGSSDNTVQKAKDAGAHVLIHEKNLGKGAAMKTLFEYVKKNQADIIVTIDGDGQFLPEEIPQLIIPILEKKADIVIGYRFEDNEEMPAYRKFGNKMLDKMTNLATDLPFRDTQSGFRAYTKNAIEQIEFITNGFGADSEILVSASKKGLKISERKVTVLYDTGSKTSTKNPISHTTGVVSSLIELIALQKPLRYLGIPGIVLMIIGVIYSGVVIAMFNETRFFSVPSTLVALGSLMVGLILLLTSLVLFVIIRSGQRGYLK
jgi:glycosyltransferase involved in cell wall biosynthesis